MNIDVFNLIPGIQIAPLEIIMMGFVEIEIELEPVWSPSGIWESEEHQDYKQELRLTIRITFRGKIVEKRYRVSMVVAKVMAKILSQRRRNAVNLLKVGATQL